MPVSSEERLLCRQVVGISAGLADKAVSHVYETTFHEETKRSPLLLGRFQNQIHDALAWLEQHAPSDGLLFGSRLSHADVLVGTSLCFVEEALGSDPLFARPPQLQGWFERLSQLAAFRATYLKFDPPQS